MISEANSLSETDGLPHGARRIELGEATLIFLRDKLVLSPAGSAKHLTLHFGPWSGTIDIHETIQNATEKSWTRLFSISRADFAKFAVEMGAVTAREYSRIFRRLRPGWMVRRRIGGVLGLIPRDEDIVAITKLAPKRKLVIDPEKFAASVVVPDFVEDLYGLSGGQPFTLVDWRNPHHPRQIGIGFTIISADGHRSLRWIAYRDLGKLLRSMQPLLIATAAKYGTFHKPLPWI